MSGKTINVFLAALVLLFGGLVILHNRARADADAQLSANGTGMLTNPTAATVASYANGNATMAQAVLNVHAAHGINHDPTEDFGGPAMVNGGSGTIIVRDAEVPEIMKEFRRLRSKEPVNPTVAAPAPVPSEYDVDTRNGWDRTAGDDSGYAR